MKTLRVLLHGWLVFEMAFIAIHGIALLLYMWVPAWDLRNALDLFILSGLAAANLVIHLLGCITLLIWVHKANSQYRLNTSENNESFNQRLTLPLLLVPLWAGFRGVAITKYASTQAKPRDFVHVLLSARYMLCLIVLYLMFVLAMFFGLGGNSLLDMVITPSLIGTIYRGLLIVTRQASDYMNAADVLVSHISVLVLMWLLRGTIRTMDVTGPDSQIHRPWSQFMPITLPRIEGSAYDLVLNEFIYSVNREGHADQPKLAAHAVAAVVRFLMENHEVEAGTLWVKKAMPLVEHITIIAPMVDKVYQSLVERAKQPRELGRPGGLLVSLAIALVAGFAWWWCISPAVIEAVIIGISMLIVAPSVIQFVSAWTFKGGRFLNHVGRHVRTQVASRRVWLPILSTMALFLLPFSTAADNATAVIAVSCIWASTTLRWITPPTVFLLGVSGSKSNELLPLLLLALFPAKVLHLLREDYQNPERGYDLKLDTLFTTSRTSGSVGWENVVTEYLHLCDRILVDLRTHSGNLEFELTIIGSSPQEDRNKVLYLVDEDTTTLPLPFDSGYEKRLCKTVGDAILRLRRGW